jgi:hypothetical protein
MLDQLRLIQSPLLKLKASSYVEFKYAEFKNCSRFGFVLANRS